MWALCLTGSRDRLAPGRRATGRRARAIVSAHGCSPNTSSEENRAPDLTEATEATVYTRSSPRGHCPAAGRDRASRRGRAWHAPAPDAAFGTPLTSGGTRPPKALRSVGPRGGPPGARGVAPCPSVLVTLTRPPCSSTSWRTSDNPMPSPLCRRLDEGSACKAGCFASSGSSCGRAASSSWPAWRSVLSQRSPAAE